MEYLLLIYFLSLFIATFSATVYHRGQLKFTKRIGEKINEKTTARMIAKVHSYHKEVMVLSVIPIINTITAIVMLLGALRELLDGVDDLIIKMVDMWRRFKAFVKR